MTDVTKVLSRIESGDPSAAGQLLPLVYNELRKLAAAKLTREKPGQTLQATALVHEAYVRLVDAEKAPSWESRRHFFVAAAEAMRRILIDKARRKRRFKHGGSLKRQELDESAVVMPEPHVDILELDRALVKLEGINVRKAQVVKLRYFAGMTVEETAAALGVSASTVDRDWTYARAWLYRETTGEVENRT